MIFEYQSARDFFGAVRQAAVETERFERQIERMEAAEGVRAQGYGPSARGPRGRGMGATDARIDYEARTRRRMDRNYELIARACELCYGADNTGGVAALAGAECADALWWRCCCAWSWRRVASFMDASVSTVRRWCDVGMECVDGMGAAAALAGSGIAEG